MPKRPLKDLWVGRSDYMAFDKPECVQKELPSGDSDDDRDYQREYRNDCLLEFLIDRQRLPLGS